MYIVLHAHHIYCNTACQHFLQLIKNLNEKGGWSNSEIGFGQTVR